MASKPSSATIASEPLTSTSEIQTDTLEPSQLEYLPKSNLNISISIVCCVRLRTHFPPPIEEVVLASGKYHLQKKQTDTGEDDEELMALLGLVEGDSRAGQGSQSKHVTMQDQATSPIMIEDDASENNDDERTPDTSNRSANDRFQELLRELFTPVRREPVKANDEEKTEEDSAMKAGLQAMKANQEEISCWYNYAKGCEDRVKMIRESDSRLNGQQAMTQVYNEVKAHLPDITMANLRSGFEGTYEEHVEYIDCFYARKASSYLVDGQKIYPFCGMAICFSCNELIYLGIEHLSVGVRCIYNALEEYMKMKQRIPLDKWMSFHQYDLQINQFGKFRRREPYTSIIDNNYILENFGIYAEEKLYSYALWLENVSRRIRRIRQRRAFLSAPNCKSNTSELYISSLFAKQNNLLPLNYNLNHPKGTAMRNYKKRPESLAKRIWEVVRNDGTPDEKKFLDIKNESSVQPGYICCGYDESYYPVRNEWMSEKIAQLWMNIGLLC
ncbi:hypothetical protein C1646_815401 [Rhizophagus diaphanus]|nr:hypothetical protein C1646_815401 [Rhizophagus diaphanus] [Rhizophagus sp. MUCL 43196]